MIGGMSVAGAMNQKTCCLAGLERGSALLADHR